MTAKVLFITKVYFLDASLEYINEVKEYCDLNVVIEIDPASKHANILDVDNLPSKGDFFKPEEILNKKSFELFKPYIDGCKSFLFIVHQNPKSVSFSSVMKSIALKKHIKRVKPDFIHFDDVSLRLIWLTFIFSFIKSKLIMNVHDPVQHSGEKNKKMLLTRDRFYPKVYKFVTFSKYSQELFQKAYSTKKKCIALPLKPYLYFRNYIKSQEIKKEYITFAGRVSEYKGIDIFIGAIEILNTKYPEQKYCIAGLPVSKELGIKLQSIIKSSNVEFIFRHIENEELVSIYQKSLAIVCPYKDATQSGVLMTAIALNTKVIVSDKGGLPEYVVDESVGYVSEASPEDLAKKIELFIQNKSEISIESDLKKWEDKFVLGKEKILELYS